MSHFRAQGFKKNIILDYKLSSTVAFLISKYLEDLLSLTPEEVKLCSVNPDVWVEEAHEAAAEPQCNMLE